MNRRFLVAYYFSLMELLFVLLIAILMISVSVPSFSSMLKDAEVARNISIVKGQLDVGYAKAAHDKVVTRVVFSYDPPGFGLLPKDVLSVTNNHSGDINLAYEELDSNCDGVPRAFNELNRHWLKCYAVLDTFANNTEPDYQTLYDPNGDNNLVDTKIIGHCWIRRPVGRIEKNKAFVDSYIYADDLRFFDTGFNGGLGASFILRPILNEGLDFESTKNSPKLAIIEKHPLNNRDIIKLIPGEAGEVDLDKLEADMQTDTNNIYNVYRKSVAIFEKKADGARYLFIYGSFCKSKESDLIVDAIVPDGGGGFDMKINIDWYQKTMVNKIYLENDDEDLEIDEGMSVIAQPLKTDTNFGQIKYRLPMNPADKASDSLADPNDKLGDTYDDYFKLHSDAGYAYGTEFYMGTEGDGGVLLRRVWGVAPGGINYELLYKNEGIVTPVGTNFTGLFKILPSYFSVVFDLKSGSSGINFVSSFGSVPVKRLIFQLCDRDGDYETFVVFDEGISGSGLLSSFGILEKDLPEIFKGKQ